MSLRNYNLREEYRNQMINVIDEFYYPMLKESVRYDRAVAFFSSTSLVENLFGITELIKNGGKIRLIVTPHLSDRDIKEIRNGYIAREEYAASKIIAELDNISDEYELSKVSLLAYLIKVKKLEIKVACSEMDYKHSLYHEKLGLFYDKFGNYVSFSGSMNESGTAFLLNYETIDVFTSWKDQSRCKRKRDAFELLWRNEDSKCTVKKFQDIDDFIINKYSSIDVDFDVDEKEYKKYKKTVHKQDLWIKYPDWFEIREYQIEAIKRWKNNGYRGIYDMATGTGKTLTALSSICELYNSYDNSFVVIILCPLQHLVEQWVEDIVDFGVKPIVCYSKYKWEEKLKRNIRNFNLKVKKNILVITTNSTFQTEKFQKYVNHVKGKKLIVVDEAHNLGSKKMRELANERFDFRLGLSATIERHQDEDGTEFLIDFFEGICFSYPLELAIKKRDLTPYYYYPNVVYLTEAELEEYIAISIKISKFYNYKNEDANETVERLLIKRARKIAGAENKLQKFQEILKRGYSSSNNILVYCGATNVSYESYNEEQVEVEELRQLEAVIDIMANKEKMRVSKYTSEESVDERSMIKEKFQNTELIQALVAIRCLDEGVNIPGIKTAFLIASSTNPKEHIQRRGRVLRLYEDKTHAEIFDFIVLPQKPFGTSVDISKSEKSLINKELMRLKEFASMSLNPSVSMRIEQQIQSDYNYIYLGGEDFE